MLFGANEYEFSLILLNGTNAVFKLISSIMSGVVNPMDG
ncbi:hypothetical protein VCHA37P191_120120 [Vibrio chagasii]|nr:hypothetical protein VCHA37P191_120120 [Vibrio chagasii]CAH6958591.1 hypothetical protein VCHA49P380_130120 [Vibrio chagasii]